MRYCLKDSRRLHILLLPCLLVLTMAHAFAQQVVPLMMSEQGGGGNTHPAPRPRVEKILRYLESELTIRFEIHYYPYNRMFMNLKNGEGLAFGLSKTAGRSAYLRFSAPVYSNFVWLVMRGDARFEFNGLQDLKGKTVGVIAGSTYGDEFDHAKISLFRVEDDPPNLLARCKKLYLRRMDAILISSDSPRAELVEQHLNRRLQPHMLEISNAQDVLLSVAGKPVWTDEIHFATGLGYDPALIERLNAAIEKGKKTGAFDAILSSAVNK
jgi:polar amino acid transport system substrate-binding protein